MRTSLTMLIFESKTNGRPTRKSTRCPLLLLAIPLLAAALVSSASSAESDGRHDGIGNRPNILLIVIDDLNDWVTCLDGHPGTHTPHVDRLAKRGVLFTNAHCQAPICNPSRTSFMLGVRPSTTGIYMNSPWFRQTPSNQDRVTLTQHFAAQGYKTFTTGKIYHGSRFDPLSFQVEGPRPGQKNALDKRIQQELTGLWDFGPQDYDEAKFNDFVDASWAAEQLQATHDKPIFLTVGFYRPHVPLYAPKRTFEQIPRDAVQLPPVQEDDRDDLPATALRVTQNNTPPPHDWFVKNDLWRDAVQAYLACVRFTDEQVGRVLDALDAGPHADNTIVVLLSDHGFHLGEKQRWAKQSLWERSTRVPFIISVPGGLESVRCSRPVELLSVYPTLIDLCRVEKRPELEGVSLVPLLSDPDARWERSAITTYGPNNHAIRTERWRYIRYYDGSEELYDHDVDAHEWNNLAGDAKFDDVKTRLAEWLPTTNVPKARGRKGVRNRSRAKR
ncbi:MAG: sulfatase [Pirellulaceae bacterium]